MQAMEDAHAAVLKLDAGVDNSNTFFAVYDGHGGGTVAKFAGQNVHKRLVSEEAYKNKQYKEALKRAFLGTDEDLLSNPAHVRDPSGCTAVAALVTNDKKIYVANAGDSRSVISVKGEVKPLSYDHKPSSPTEKARITGAGGYIEYGRVNGNLALSRALGDFEFKKNYSMSAEKQVITADPDVTEHDITDEDEFLIIACDGIWDCLTSQQVVDFVRLKVSEGKELTEIGEEMCELCLAPDTSSGAGIGCDNMTVLVVALLNGRTKEEWYAWVTDRVKQNYGYETPRTLPQIYAQSRLMAFKARREAQEERDRMRTDRDDQGGGFMGAGSAFGGFARVLGSTGGMTFHPSGGISGGGLMFGNDDSDDEDDDDMLDVNSGRSFFSDTLGIGGPRSPDATSSLKAQLDDFEKDIRNDIDDDMEDGEHEDPLGAETSHVEDTQPAQALQGEAPPPPATSQPNGDIKPVEQLSKPPPDSETPSAAVKADGLMDGSEDPTRA
ncbi:hypothetical protein HWV62_45685 [Athelia sp. TMB]|nr:hypothetical protein HWV62_45685 [Athelia sp. TMB]